MTTPAESTSPSTPPGWYPDPQAPDGSVRWWDGGTWTDHVASPESGGAPTPPPASRPPGAASPVVPAAGLQGLYARNQYASIAVIVSLAYVVIGLATHFVLLGIVPIVFAVRAFMRKEQLAFVGAIAAVAALVFALAGSH